MKSHNEFHRKTTKPFSRIPKSNKVINSALIKMRKKLLFIIAIIFVILGLGIYFFINQQQQKAAGLRNFYKLTENDPLFYSSFFDSKEWEKSIGGLKDSENQLKKVITDNLKQTKRPDKNYYLKTLQENNIFPYQFLEDLILINQKTDEFLKNPSSKLGNELLNLYDKAADSYIQDASSKIEILETADKGDSCFLIFVDNLSSCKIVKNDLLVIKENGNRLKSEVAQRKKCLSGKTFCPESPQNAKKMDDFVDSLKAKFNLKGKNIDLIKKMSFSPSGSIENKIGPYKIKSLCWKSPNSEQWLYLIYQNRDGKTSILPKLATQNYYWKLDAKNTPLQIVDKYISKVAGINYYLQIETATYECTDLTFYPQLLSLDFLKKKIEPNKITAENLNKNLEYKLLIENKFGLLAPAINTTSHQLETFKLYMRLNKQIPTLSSIFSTRIAYSLFYFPYAKSIWRIDKQLQYFIPEKEKPFGVFTPRITLDELIKLDYTEKEINNFRIPTNETDLNNYLILRRINKNDFLKYFK